jgi:peptide-methionine (S)-S-oxide reductase
MFNQLKGVHRVESGYTGGSVADPSYEAVCGGATGHAEAVRIRFDPSVVRYRDLLEVFFTIHDPTTLNRQGNDVGSQYRSAIFWHTPEQKAAAEEVIARLGGAGLWGRPLVTELAPAGPFYVAEDYHRDYFQRNPGQPYCMFVVAPKVAKARKHFLDRLKT